MLFCVYVITAKLGLMMDAVNGYATLVWPPTGIALAALVIFGNRLWPAIAAAAFLVNLTTGASLWVAAAMGMGNALEAVIGAHILRRRGFHPTLGRLQDVINLIVFAALLSTTVSATIGVTSLWLGGVIDRPAVRSTWSAWWVGDMMGALIVAPLLMCWAQQQPPSLRVGAKRIAETIALGIGIFVICLAIIEDPTAGLSDIIRPYWVFPLIIWVALRFDARATVTTTFVTAVAAVWATAHGIGAFSHTPLNESLKALHFFLGTLAVTALTLASAVSERINAERRASESQARVKRQAADLNRSAAELRQAKDAAEAANAAKSAFLANMSHEIRTPLGAVLGFSELLVSQRLSPSERDHYGSAIRRNGELLSSIINDILDISKVEAGKLDVEILRVPLVEVLSDVTTMLNLQAQEKGLRLTVTAAGPIPRHVTTDALRLRQILINVVGNAIKFTQRGFVEVTLRLLPAKAGSQCLAFVVKDSGAGIDPEKVDQLFEAFSQADVSTKRRFGGTGLGLVLSKRLANLLGGDVVLTASEPGVGTTFTVTIDPGAMQTELAQDIAAEVMQPPPLRQAAAQDIRLDGIDVLLVEDAPDNQLLVGRYLRGAGAQVETANNGAEALAKTRRKTFDILLMDLQMPVMDGYEATASLRQSGYRKPIIALTAHALKDERRRCLASGFDDHIGKPINRAGLLASVARLCPGLHDRPSSTSS